MFDAVRLRVNELYAKTIDDAPLIKLAQNLADDLEKAAPSDTGTLAEALSEVGDVKARGEVYTIGVGNKTRTGEPNKKTPGTIADFLMAYPEYKMTRWEFGIREDRRGRPWETRLAWWFLSVEAREKLHDLREQGLYGGPAYSSGAATRYYFVRSQDKPDWEISAYYAGLEEEDDTKFTTDTIKEWRGQIEAVVRTHFASRQ